jgi:hypothetical protein
MRKRFLSDACTTSNKLQWQYPQKSVQMTVGRGHYEFLLKVNLRVPQGCDRQNVTGQKARLGRAQLTSTYLLTQGGGKFGDTSPMILVLKNKLQLVIFGK